LVPTRPWRCLTSRLGTASGRSPASTKRTRVRQRRSSFVVGDGNGTNGLITVSDTEADTYLDGNGTYLANAGGKLYTVADTIDIVYTASGTPGTTKPVVDFLITVQQEWP